MLGETRVTLDVEGDSVTITIPNKAVNAETMADLVRSLNTDIPNVPARRVAKRLASSGDDNG